MSLPYQVKVQEARVRRKADRRRGLTLERSRRRDPLAPDYGLYRLRDPAGLIVNESHSLDDLEAWLSEPV